MSLLSPVATASCRQIIATERKQKPGVSFSFAAMKLSTALFAPAFGILVGLPALLADEPAAPAPPPDSRYGLFNQLDHRSSYAQDVFPEPFLVDDSAAEDDEARLDWLHTTADASKSDVITAEVEKGFGLLTLEIEVPYERDVQGGDVSQGVGNIDLGARYPLYQFVSAKGFWDTTFGSGVELGIPTEWFRKSSMTPESANILPHNPSLVVRPCSGPAMMAVGKRLNTDSISATRSSTGNCHCPACYSSFPCSNWPV
jgi:hypothetical protein